MKIQKLFGCTGLLIMASVLPQKAHTQDSIKLTSGEWPPFVSKNLADDGFLSRVVSGAFQKKGIKVEYDYFPWARGYKYMFDKNRGYSGSLAYVWSETRSNVLLYSKPIYIGYGCFFYLKEKGFDCVNIPLLVTL